MIGRGVAYHKTDETDLLWSKRGSCSPGGVWHTAKWTKRTSYGRNGGPVHREGCGVPQNGTPRDTVHLHRRPPPASTTRTPPATVQPPLHRLLFIHPSTPQGPVQPPLHGHPSTIYCSSSPPHHGFLFIQRQRRHSLFIQTPPQRSLLASVAKESLHRVQLTAIDRSLGFSNA